MPRHEGPSRRLRMESFVRRPDLPRTGRLLLSRRELLAATAVGAAMPRVAFAATPDGQLTYGVHVSLAPNWFDPADTLGIITPFMVLYALHDAMVKPMPGKVQAPCLAESWNASEDGLSYDFTIRNGAKFHNGEPVTAEDVKFSYERYRGVAHELMKDQLAGIDVVDPQHVRFRLKKPWPDFAVARHPRAPGRQSRARPRGHEQGAVPRLLQDHQQRGRPLHLRLLLAAAAGGQRPGQGQEAAGRSRSPERVRCRAAILRQ